VSSVPSLSPVVKFFIRSKVSPAFKNTFLGLMAYISRHPADRHEFEQMICEEKKGLFIGWKSYF
jgi:hypothetical protein